MEEKLVATSMRLHADDALALSIGRVVVKAVRELAGALRKMPSLENGTITAPVVEVVKDVSREVPAERSAPPPGKEMPASPRLTASRIEPSRHRITTPATSVPDERRKLPGLPKLSCRVKHIPDFPGYALSKDGRLWSCLTPGARGHFSAEWHEVKPYSSKRSPRVELRRDQCRHRRSLLHLTHEIFGGAADTSAPAARPA